MPLEFPNRSRSYDASGYRVRFWGHDGAMEVSFFLDDAVILRFDPRARREETSILKGFDANMGRILEVAAKAYARRRKSSCMLVAADF